MHNLFPPRPLLEEMADAASGAAELQPRRTLRRRHYKTKPLKIKPDYDGDFLDKIRDQDPDLMSPDLMEGEGIYIRAGNPTNLLDFTMPSEMLKHQERPYPRENPPAGIPERNRPDEGAGMDTIQDWYDRGWDPNDAPEMSEDKHLRMWGPRDCWPPLINKNFLKPQLPIEEKKKAHRIIDAFCSMENKRGISASSNGPDPKNVVAQYMLGVCSAEIELDTRNKKTAKYLNDLSDPEQYSKKRGYKPVTPDRVYPIRMSPKEAKFIFGSRADTYNPNQKRVPDNYRIIFQFIPSGVTRDVNKLHVRVSCTCPSFLYYGAQYNAGIGTGDDYYLYGKVRPLFLPPNKKDPQRRFTVCKHILGAIPMVMRYKLPALEPRVKRRLKRKPKVEVEKEKIPEEKIKIPPELRGAARKQPVKGIIKKWPDMTPDERAKFIEDLKNPDDVAYLAHRFPMTATKPIIEKLRDMAKKRRKREPTLARRADRYADRIEKMAGAAEKLSARSGVKVAAEDGDQMKALSSIWGNMNQNKRRDFVYSLEHPDEINGVMIMFPDAVELCIERLLNITQNGLKHTKEAQELLEYMI